MKFSFVTESVEHVAADVFFVPLFKGEVTTSAIVKTLDAQFDRRLVPFLKQEQFVGKEGECAVVPSLGIGSTKRLVFVGVGEREKVVTDSWRKLGGQMARRARDVKAKSIAIAWPSVRGASVRPIAEALSEGLLLGSYKFHTYRGSSLKEADKHEVEEVFFVTDKTSRASVQSGVDEAVVLSSATNLARTLVNTPSHDMTPMHLAEAARDVTGKSKRISLFLLEAEEMRKQGMEATLAVGRGSHEPPMGAHLTYRPKGKAKKRIAIVGKAVTFDSGGLSLKTADGMTTMKIDMAGAAAVLGLFQALSALDVPLEVHGIFLAVENMPSGSAYRPGDIVRAKNGTTIEVLNTDAEGRLTLADALSYAAELKPDAIIDLATLTGACVAALGEEIIGLLSNDRKLTERLQRAGTESGEDLWELPLYKPYEDHIKSKIADIKNTGQRGAAGTISSALFLQHFVGKIPWAHLDIAGPAYAERETRSDIPFGGTGSGARLLVRYLQALS